MKRMGLFLGLLALVFAGNAFAAKELAITKGDTEFLAVGKPSAIKIAGKSSVAQGNLKYDQGKLSGTVEVVLDSFDTGISMRNKHMKEKYLEVDKFPKAILAIDPLAVGEAGGALHAKQVPFTGTLTLHGKTQPVKGDADLTQNGDSVAIDARFQLKIGEYDIAVPSYAGITVTDEVSVKSSLVAAVTETKATETKGATNSAKKK